MKLYVLLAAFFLSTNGLQAMDIQMAAEALPLKMGLWDSKLKDWVISIEFLYQKPNDSVLDNSSTEIDRPHYIIRGLNKKINVSGLDHITIKEATTTEELDDLEQLEALDQRLD